MSWSRAPRFAAILALIEALHMPAAGGSALAVSYALADSGDLISTAAGSNDAGQIVASATTPDGGRHGAVLTPEESGSVPTDYALRVPPAWRDAAAQWAA
jgi:hypothetical protein